MSLLIDFSPTDEARLSAAAHLTNGTRRNDERGIMDRERITGFPSGIFEDEAEQ